MKEDPVIGPCDDQKIALVLYAAAHVPEYRKRLIANPAEALRILGLDANNIAEDPLKALASSDELSALASGIVSSLIAAHDEGDGRAPDDQMHAFIGNLQKCGDDSGGSRDDGPIRTFCQNIGPLGFGLAARLAYDKVFYELAKCNPGKALSLMGLDSAIADGIDASNLASQQEIRDFLLAEDGGISTADGDGAQVKDFWLPNP